MLSRTVNNRRPLQQPCARARACFVARASASSTSQQQQPQLLDEELLLADLRVVLVAPKTEANVGAVCRAMANFEAPQLTIVAPRCDVRAGEVEKVACSTFITDRLRVAASLEEALADTVGSIGFTRRTGATRFVQPSLGDLLHSFPGAVPGLRAQPPGAAQGSAGTVALVFGREESGLTEDEMRLMSHLCAIPSGRVHPSLNLSHAVTVVLAECFGRRAGIYGAGVNSPQGVPSTNAGSAQDSADAQFWRQSGLQLGGRETNMQQRLDYAPASDTEALLKKLGAVATASGVSSAESSGPSVHGRKRLPLGHIRAILGRAMVTEKEVRSLHGFVSAVLSKLEPGHALGKRKPGSNHVEAPEKTS